MKKKLVKIINLNEEATDVASPRSRKSKKHILNPHKAGTDAQRQFVDMITKMFNPKNMKIEVEPNVDTINNIINKKDKKKLN
jgi:hypothetical protein